MNEVEIVDWVMVLMKGRHIWLCFVFRHLSHSRLKELVRKSSPFIKRACVVSLHVSCHVFTTVFRYLHLACISHQLVWCSDKKSYGMSLKACFCFIKFWGCLQYACVVQQVDKIDSSLHFQKCRAGFMLWKEMPNIFVLNIYFHISFNISLKIFTIMELLIIVYCKTYAIYGNVLFNILHYIFPNIRILYIQ